MDIRLVEIDEFCPRLASIQREFPKLLPSRRLFLRALGETSGLCEKRRFRLAIVGTRRCTGYAREVLHALLRLLPPDLFCIVSGGAVGVDALAHQAALDFSIPTRAWLVGPIQNPGPQWNRALFGRILKQDGGALLVPEFLQPEEGCGPSLGRAAWLARNAWIAADCDALLVVEALEKSGTWESVKMAHEFSRPVFCVPGSIFNKSSHGTHKMISASYAQIVQNLDTFVEELIAHAKRHSL